MARTVWLFDLSEFNPKGLNLWAIYEWLIKKYHFASFPKNVLDVNADKALAFQAGTFVNSKTENILVSLAVYNNGLAAEAYSSTDDSDEFVEEVGIEISKQFGLKIPSNVQKAYVSQLEADFDFSLAGFNPKLTALADLLSTTVKPADGKLRTFDFGALQLWTDDVNPSTSPAYFRFERKIGSPFARNRYFSQAALKTKVHRDFLEKFEAAFQL